jgi:iron complex outermembrane receptor protein
VKTLVLSLTLASGALAQVAPARPDSARRDSAATLEAVTVNAIRGRGEAPISSATLTQQQIERRHIGQDVPMLLQGTPSLTSYSETGGPWGYSYMRLRGIDQSRINLSLDGIPLNDPEDQVLYFADFPDLANSIHSIQIQRGVGTSAPGTASYGGSINFQTLPLLTTLRNAELQLQGGSFGSRRASAEYSTGTLTNGLSVYGRLSALQSEGYRHHSGTEGRSAFLAAAHVGARHVLKLTAIAGLFADTLAYIGASRAQLAGDRRFNALRADEVDRFGERVAALSYTRQFAASSLASTVYRISASGNYDVCVDFDCTAASAALWNFNLDFRWYGATSVWSRELRRARLSLGVNGNTYERDHHAYARPDLAQPLYFNTGHKDDGSVFGKLAFDLTDLVTLFGDLQLRHARFRYDPDANAGIVESSIDWTFVNPKAGLTITLPSGTEAYASFGLNSREPARSDMFAGFDNIDTTNASFVGPLETVRAERAHDLEAGVRLRRPRWTASANAFAMEFRNEILPVGALSYIGTPLRTNVPASWRRGIEVDLAWKPSSRIEAGVNATGMRSRIREFTDATSGTSYRNTEALMSPRFISGQRVSLAASPSVTLSLNSTYTSRAQLDNTGNAALTLPAAWIGNVSGEWRIRRHALGVHVNNVTNADAYGGGHVVGGEARYFVVQPVNLFIAARLVL